MEDDNPKINPRLPSQPPFSTLTIPNQNVRRSFSMESKSPDLAINYRSSVSSIRSDGRRTAGGLSNNKAAFFMVAQLVGAGFLALPRAIADSGWIGIVTLTIFCISVGFAAVKLSQSWVIMEQRYPECRLPVRQPYIEIVTRTLGTIGRKISITLLLITNMGSIIVYIILIAQLLNNLLPSLSVCEYTVIAVVLLTPFTWFGTPKDFWQVPLIALLATAFAIFIIIGMIINDYGVHPIDPTFEPSYPNPTIATFAMGFGALFFSFGGLSVFPTVQNDMKDRSEFKISVVKAYSVTLSLYLPIALIGYIYIGDDVNSNVILSISKHPVVTAAVVLEIVNLMGTLLIVFNPVTQCFEDLLNAPTGFGIKRISIRSGVMVVHLLIALAFPDFGLVINFIGGFAMTILGFILPPIMYMKLIDDRSDPSWEVMTIPKWQRIYLWEIVGVGVVGGTAATVTSLFGLLSPEQFASSCFCNFN